jgi:hypothetical protein
MGFVVHLLAAGRFRGVLIEYYNDAGEWKPR